MYFTFESKVCLQIDGPPMGSSISWILAILFMDKLESTALSSFRSIITYKRYVDDIYFETTDEARAAEFHQIMNAAYPRLTFEMETPRKDPDGLLLSLLDFTVTIFDQGTILLSTPPLYGWGVIQYHKVAAIV
ncbi:hypothetical protein QZH41_004672 [Actinostola sp. cb2023]|nr:hypothetical protein QZH41_004672 [Actinostola sp. cb2023]